MVYYRKPNPYASKIKESVLNKVLEIMETNKRKTDDGYIVDYEKLKEEIYKIW